ncbi:MAG: hypothetical protein CVV11_21465, partial [Gammaproteobacteria bacterium HGW-Gammaproteobacteria-15]
MLVAARDAATRSRVFVFLLLFINFCIAVYADNTELPASNAELNNCIPLYIQESPAQEGEQSVANNNVQSSGCQQTPPYMSDAPVVSVSGTTITVSWSYAINAYSYLIQQRINGGTWQTMPAVWGGLSQQFSGTIGNSYQYQVAACNDWGCSGYWVSNSVSIVPVPAVPAKPTASVNINEVTLGWSVVSGATGYRIRQNINGTWELTEVNVGAVSSRGFPNSVAGSYQYQIRACNVNGQCSGYSPVSNSVTVLPVPAVPAKPGIGFTAANALNVTWNSVSGAVTYRLRQSTNGTWSTTETNTGSATSRNFPGLGVGSYQYQVKACNVNGQCSGWSAASDARSVLVVPAIPAKPGAGFTAANALNVTWNPVSGAVTYRLRQSTNGTWQTTETNAGNATSRGFPSLGVGSYQYQVKACNANNYCSDWSAASDARSVLAVPAVPAKPGTTISGNSITASWVKVNGATSYTIRQSRNGSWQADTNVGDVLSKPFPSLAVGSYQYQVRACNANGQCSGYSTASDMASILPVPPLPPTPVASLISANGITVSWIGSGDCQIIGSCHCQEGLPCIPLGGPGPEVLQKESDSGALQTADVGIQSSEAVIYYIRQSLNGSWQTEISAGTAISKAFSGLGEGSYQYQVRACNANGQCSAHTPVSNSISVQAVPVVPTTPTASVSGTELRVNWLPTSGATSYRVQQRTNGGNWNGDFYASTNSYSMGGVAGSSYQYQVKACNASNYCSDFSAASNQVSLPPVPAIPTGLAAELDGTSINTSWHAATHATVYRVRQSVNGTWQDEINKGTTRAHSFAITPGANHQYQARACNSSGCSNWSAATATVTPPPLPAVPSTPTANLSGSNIMVSWGSNNPPIDPCHITGTCYCDEFGPCTQRGEPAPVETLQLKEETGQAATQSSGATYWLQGYKDGAVWGEEVVNISGTSSSRPWTQVGSYTFKVRACNSSGCSNYTALSNAVTISQVATPVTTPNGGSHSSQVNVTLSTTTSGATIRYTLNNSAVTASSAQYTAAIPLSQSTTIRAKAFKAGMAESSELVKSFTVLQPVATPTISPNGGTHSNLVNVSLATTTSDATLRYTIDNSPVNTASTIYTGSFILPNSATVRVKAFKSGMAESSETAATFTVLQQVATPSITPDGGSHASSVTVSLQSATTGAVLRYTANNTAVTASSTAYTGPLTFTANATLRVKAFKNGMADSIERSANFTILQPAKAPTITPDGGKHAGSVSVSLTTATQGASIRYTTDNSSVSENSALYSASIQLNATATIRAKSFKSGMAASPESSATFTITEFPEANTPPVPVLKQPSTPGSNIDKALTLPGQFSVNQTGQANYTIPILAAKGSTNMSPALNLNYSSGGANGLLGLGWSLSGAGSITRCRQTEAADRNPLPISWSSTDRFCLNGQRLLVVTGNYGAVGSVYKTEIDTYSKVTASGGSNGHPDYFKVEYKDGTWETYGNTTDSANAKNKLADGNTRILSWALSKRSDSAGNKIIYKYHLDSAGHRLDTIDFAFGNGSSRNAYIKFDYEQRADPISGYVTGHQYRTAVRLNKITSYNGTQELRQYRLSYNLGTANTSYDNLSRLSRIQECVGSNCTEATNFDWSVPVAAISQTASSMSFNGGVSQFRLGDINGDGLMDIAWYEQAETKDLHNNLKPRAYRYALASMNNGSFSWSPSFRSPLIYDDMQLNIIDLNNDGRAEVVAGQGDRLTTVMYLDINSDGLIDRLSSQYQRPWVNYHTQGAAALRLGSADASLSTSAENYYAQRAYTPLKQLFTSTAHIPANFGDISVPETWYLRRNANGQIILNNLHLSPIHSLTGLTGDVDGDGRMDIVAYTWANHGQCYQDNDYDHCEWENSVPVLYSMQQAAFGQFELVYKDGFHIVPDPAYAFMIDLNGDGLSDMVYARGHDDWAFRLSNGVSFEEPVAINIPGRAFYTYNRDNTDVTLADFNGDGYPDIIWHSPNAPFSSTTTGTGSGTIKVKYWEPAANRFSDDEVTIRSQGYNILTNYSDPRFGWDYRTGRFKASAIQMVDVNADGKPDLLITPTTQGGSATVYLGLTPEQPENTIIAIHKGLGDSIEVEYETLTESAHYARGDVIQSPGEVQHCTNIADTFGSYSRHTCWNVSVGETTPGNFYRNLNDPWYKLSSQQQSLKPKEPAFAKAGAMYVVTGVSTSAPTNNNESARYHTAYFYEQARLQASGRGFLGFEYFTTVDRETGIRTRQQYRQDWPYTGKLWRTEVYTAEGHKLGANETTYGLVQCYSNGVALNSCVTSLSNTLAARGSSALGPLQLFAAKQAEQNWALSDNGNVQGILLKDALTLHQFDGHGNSVVEELTIKDGYGAIQQSVLTTRIFDKNGSTWSMQQGRLKQLQVTSTNEHGSISRVSEFDYYSSGSDIGLLKTETIEPDNSEYKVVTTHAYSNGNLVLSTMVADGQTRVKDIRYDSIGRYINETYELFSNDSTPDSGISRRAYSVVSRDRYGMPSEERFYTGASTYTTKLTGTTVFGTTYFNSDSSGSYSVMDGGLGVGPGNVCPAGTVSWRRQQEAGGGVSLACLDTLQRITREAMSGFSANTWRVTDTERDKRGLVSRSSAPYLYSQESPLWSSYQYDVLGRVTQTESSVNNGTSVITEINYDGYDTTTVNGLSQQRTDTFNALGQLQQVTDPNNGVTSYRYDARGNLVHMTDPAGNATQIQYDLRDRKISMVDPNKGSWSYKYNRFSELVCQQDAKGQITQQKYDLQGRLFSRTEYKSGGSCDIPSGSVEKFSRWEYDTAANGLGKLQRVYDSTAINGSAQYQQSYSYDALGRLSITTTRMPGHLNQMGEHYEKTTYDQYGRIFQQFDAARSSSDFNVNGVEYRYSETGYLQQLVDSVNRNGRQQAFYAVQQMDARGNVTNAEYANGVTMQHEYYRDSGLAKELRSYAITGGSTALQQLELVWDEIGNLQSRHETGSAGALNRRNVHEAFQYDSLNQLTRWQTTGELALTETASISGIGNILSKSGVGTYKYGSSCSHSSNAGPNAVCQAGSTTYVYDNNGALISDSSGRSMQYTVSNLLSEVSKGGHTTRFNYNPMGQRYKRTDIVNSQTTTTLYLGSVEKVHYPDNTIEWKRDIAGVGLFSQKMNSSGTVLEERQRYQVKD